MLASKILNILAKTTLELDLEVHIWCAQSFSGMFPEKKHKKYFFDEKKMFFVEVSKFLVEIFDFDHFFIFEKKNHKESKFFIRFFFQKKMIFSKNISNKLNTHEIWTPNSKNKESYANFWFIFSIFDQDKFDQI